MELLEDTVSENSKNFPVEPQCHTFHFKSYKASSSQSTLLTSSVQLSCVEVTFLPAFLSVSCQIVAAAC